MNRNAKSLQKKSNKHQAEHLGGRKWRVTSATSGKAHKLAAFVQGDTLKVFCDCEFVQFHAGRTCSHQLAVKQAIEVSTGRKLSFWQDADQALRQHRPVSVVKDLLATSRLVGGAA